MAQKEAIFITEWKDKMRDIIRNRFGNKLNDSKVEKYLDEQVRKNLCDPKVSLVNNYTNQEARTTVLGLIDLIRENNLIIGGSAVLYCQHDVKDNLLLGFIMDLKKLRKVYKNNRKKYAEDTYEWLMQDIFQSNTKVKINSLYGIHGYPLFALYNRFIAEAITNCGRQIISTAVMTFENFLSGSIEFNTESEVYMYINNIIAECGKSKMITDIFDTTGIEDKIIKRLLSHCAFEQSDDFIINIQKIVDRQSMEAKILLYYKNNLFEFSRNSFIREKIRYIVDTLDELKSPSFDDITDDSVKQTINDIWDFYNTFVVYDYPVFDRVRKAMYTDRHNVLYVDTDSNFLALNEWVCFCKQEILNNAYNKPETDIEFIAVNLLAIILSRVIDKGLHTLCYNMNVTKKYADMLEMKNEFYLDKILFTDAKKRYISNAILQEGKLLGHGLGKEEIKGFDFKKASVKPFVKEYYTKICLEDILRAEPINIETIFTKIMELRKDIEESMKRGDSKYYKQANVQVIEHYKKPYSNQNICAIYLWNTLCKEYALELPTDVDIIPIRPLGKPKSNSGDDLDGKSKGKLKINKTAEWLSEKYPETYAILERDIYNNPNPLVANMSLSYIAKPKNANVELPQWLFEIIDTEKVVLDTIKLFHPILQSLGLKILKTNASTEYMTNIVDL